MGYKVDKRYDEEHEHETQDVVLQGFLTKVDTELVGVIDFINNLASVQVLRSCQDKNGKVWMNFDMMEFISFLSTAYGAKREQEDFESLENTPDSTHSTNLYDFLIYHCHRDLVLEYFEDFSDETIERMGEMGEEDDFDSFVDEGLEQKANCFISLTFDKEKLDTFKRLLYKIRSFVI